MSLLELDRVNLSIGDTQILKNISFSIEASQCLGLVGESGSGKSLTALSIMRLLPRQSRLSGTINLAGDNLVGLTEPQLCNRRGNVMGMVFQEPMTALNPLKSIKAQISESLLLHSPLTRKEAEQKTKQLLERVGLPPARISPDRFPHQLSGGQRQRVVIAIAIAMHPALIIADEPTTALDVTSQAEILSLLRDLMAEEQSALMLISHDLAVVADMADSIAIMKEGRIVEQGPLPAAFDSLSHPYSLSLFDASTHRPARKKPALYSDDPVLKAQKPILVTRDVARDYPMPRQFPYIEKQWFRAVKHIDLTIHAGQSIGLVGESGCGKSTLARALLGLEAPQEGNITIGAHDPYSANRTDLLDVRKDIQIVFQDPNGSFNPRHKVGRSVAEPLHLYRHGLDKDEKNKRIADSLKQVGLDPDIAERYPHEFSGGERQRLAIARALITRPKIIIADEPVSALDVSIRAQILDLLTDLRDRLDLAYLFISHDLSVVRAITDEVLVMYRGSIIERGRTEDIFNKPKQAYTRTLINAAPDLHSTIKRRQAATRHQ
ncbi:ABC transporter ATP-binding protein [Cohaesibacter celericrescens]|uniref:Microcin ABC transporter ATP-binding protein n=1 Tax=Cohaesibacter celericrescens TaxID=2067669 RepID=A0A2N5XU19_9HYPH|nr:dipeptide ABC transporter ATP-binding protein [Cohaesibacter celericrescens]PLW78016.1 microcin ABC transporter ATP-binding protein [Cohaesibacter celericrescens]